MEKIYDVIISGAGPAGMTAAVYASRAGLDTLILEHDAPGGKLVKTVEIQNWPGIVETEGTTLAIDMFTHSTAYGATFDGASITSVTTDENKIHTLTAADGRTFQTRTMIIATGTLERSFDHPLVQKYEGRNVSFCAICDGAFYREKEIAVFGGGNSALEEADYLTQFASKVYLVHRRDEFRADEHAITKAQANSKIEFVLNSNFKDIIEADGKFAGIVVTDNEGVDRQIDVAGMFLYIGATPRSEMLAGKDCVTPAGYITVNAKMETGIPGIYAAGDVTDKILRQVVTATNDGAVAAQEAFHYIDNNFATQK